MYLLKSFFFISAKIELFCETTKFSSLFLLKKTKEALFFAFFKPSA